MSEPIKDYLGDRIFAAHDGDNLILEGEEGTILLDRAAVAALERFIARYRRLE